MPAPDVTRLDVYINDLFVGEADRPGSGRIRFTYSDDVASEHAGEILLSANLPVRAERYQNQAAKPFFEGLLPEGTLRERIARDLQVSYDNGFDLLAKIGAECAGAVIVLPKGTPLPPSDQSEVEWLSDDELYEKLIASSAHPLGVQDRRVRLSLAGVQDKLVLTRAPSGKFGIPLEGAPSTHIIKPNQERYADIAANEAFCLKVAACARLPVAKAEVTSINDLDCLIVERFDRTWTDDMRIQRLHQEDFCQALGVLPSEKYETEGGPSVASIVEELRAVSAQPARSLLDFTNAVIFNFLIGNSDAHGKNYALLYEPVGSPSMAPLYDLVCTGVYDVEQDLAMAIGGVIDPRQVNAVAWRAFAAEVGMNERLLVERLQQMATKVVDCARAVRETAKAEEWFRPILDEIVTVCEARAAQLEAVSA